MTVDERILNRKRAWSRGARCVVSSRYDVSFPRAAGGLELDLDLTPAEEGAGGAGEADLGDFVFGERPNAP